MADKKLDRLFRQFDMYHARIQHILREIEHAEKKREIEFELDTLLEKFQITKALDDTGTGDRGCQL